ncbi:MAG: hypothetical protein ACLP9L_15965 [Thermoguttaceae bacterium]
MKSLFPEMEEDARQMQIIYEGLWRHMARGTEPYVPPEHQKTLLTGLDCLPGQENLFPTDGTEQASPVSL